MIKFPGGSKKRFQRDRTKGFQGVLHDISGNLIGGFGGAGGPKVFFPSSIYVRSVRGLW